LSREGQVRRIRSRKQITDVGKYFFVNRTIKDWNSLPAGIPAPFPCKINTSRKDVMEAVTSAEAPSWE
jgi:hypothetical protein